MWLVFLVVALVGKPGKAPSSVGALEWTSAIERELLRCWQGGTFEGFRYFCEVALLVRTGSAEGDWNYVPLVLNEEQERFARAVISARLEQRKVRFIILKARKLGLSTVVQALAVWYGSWVEAFRTKTLAHQQSATDEIGLIAEEMLSRMPERLKPYLGGRKNKGVLVWENGSKITVETQRSSEQSRGGTPSFLHISELAFWDEGRRAGSAERTLTALFGSIEEGSGGSAVMVVIETTANGVSGAFYDRWMDAQNPGSEWTPFFFPWQTATKHQIPDKTPEEVALSRLIRDLGLSRDERISGVMASSAAGSVGQEWAERAVDNGLTCGQLRWAMAKAGELGDMKTFDQEYPMSAELAFVSSGRAVLDTIAARWVKGTVTKPACRSGLLRSRPYTPLSAADASDMGWSPWLEVERVSSPGDAWYFWKAPEIGWTGRYVVGVDSSYGSGKDHAAIHVKDVLRNEQVAEFYSKTTAADVLAEQASLVGYWYGTALIVPELNGSGAVVVKDLWTARYPRIYRRMVSESDGGRDNEWGMQFGVYMDDRTRTVLVSTLVAGLKSATHRVFSSRLALEFETFRFDAKGKPDHAKGRFSDAIMAAGLAEHGRDQAGEMMLQEVKRDVEVEVDSVSARRSRMRAPRGDRFFGNRA